MVRRMSNNNSIKNEKRDSEWRESFFIFWKFFLTFFIFFIDFVLMGFINFFYYLTYYRERERYQKTTKNVNPFFNQGKKFIFW